MDERTKQFEGCHLGASSPIATHTCLECKFCWWIHHPEQGDPVLQIPPHAMFAALQAHWRCRVYGRAPDQVMVLVGRGLTVRAIQRKVIHGDPRMATLVAHFETAATSAMPDIPVVKLALRIEGTGFEPVPGETGARCVWFGMPITPWSIRPLSLPGAVQDWVECPRPAGKAHLRVGDVDFKWLGAHAQDVGAYASCSLFLPMLEFPRQKSATSGGVPRVSRHALLLRPAAFGSAP
ncbi:[NiFe] hydrogenase assembly HybE family chaperone [Paraburkholderia atlantica]|uniref:[NiFe] hydrogenase assembly HybE family chaperone n=2 Tax=Paraburkholderia TaxID=1822464 RepID=A0A7W8LE89_9BURK|nr:MULTISPECIES: [NiFe]-hydrogenase assembly chaperone HybE [Paraburkholderia]MBB5405038.1 [NiFe] hydrogenase assembly HybE family chaperone [Paraburkholderia youngii]MBB5429312.1 [NiFe] hydrogenase assembly HybE family chaperone [Paraburkholderia atlantica]MPW10801.1 [NiFe]-hydrogenase assembly chaperone HybE [Paraburkholderia atlantica]NUY35549.1 [NiFe]-hydrogenase assembly chaperone HybE [Paraburkholderia atlantica]